MSSKTTLARISGLIKARRRKEKLGLRDAARLSGISPSTLSRLERGASSTLPDVATLKNLADWLGVPLDLLLGKGSQPEATAEAELDTPQQVQVYLRADKNLRPETAEELGTMFRMLYEKLSEPAKKS